MFVYELTFIEDEWKQVSKWYYFTLSMDVNTI